ncbi:MAG: phosphatase PAP2/dual specificity phosphatase family protein [Pseudomonadota bacterium]|nr:phosphatase PAP2/dual specificity phosphatase family protein [Pseudomonadota bacterium]
MTPTTASTGPATRRRFRLAAGWLAFLAPFFYLSYGLANHFAAQRAARGEVPAIVFGWEHGMPFWAWTIFPYWSINAFYALSLFVCRSRHEVWRHGARLLTAQLIAVTCFVLWPLAFSFGQPPVQGAPALLFDALRGFDQPFNQAPSLHIALAVILWDLYRRLIRPRWARALLHGWTLLICASVLTTYQHHFIDIPTGALLGVVCVWLWPLERRVALPQAWQRVSCHARGRRRWRLAACYAAGSLACLALALGLYRTPLGGWALWLGWPAASLAVVALAYAGLSERAFHMGRQGRMHWSARWLLAPYLWGAALNAWLWTRRLPASVAVAPGLRLGRVPTRAEWQAAGRPRVVSLCAERALPAHLPGARCLPLLDLVPATPAQLRRAAMVIEASRAGGQTVWVCCALGFSRSAAACMAWLHAQGHADAESLMRAARPQMVLNDDWRAALAAAHPPLTPNRPAP